MSVCPACNIELTAASQNTGVCAACGKSLDIQHVATALLPDGDPPGVSQTTITGLSPVGSETLVTPATPSVAPKQDVSATIALNSNTIELKTTPPDPLGQTLDSSALNPPSAPIGSATMPLISQTMPFSKPLSQNDQTLDSAGLENLWGRTLTSNAPPTSTIKAEASGSNATMTDLTIRSHRMRKENEAVPEKAEYELLEMIGKGGVGVVYAARQASIDRTVALKMLRPDFATEADHREKFLAEAIVTGELDHPNIVPIYDLGTNDDGALFYSMKRVRGTPWSKVIAKTPLNENLDILLRVADAVAFAHDRGVVHRDLKPENVMLGDYGEVLVMDWGIALALPSSSKSKSINATGLGGTPAYMAPEMAMGPMENIGPASDVYLLGAILYEIVAGFPPHTGSDVMKCVMAATRNEIRPAGRTSELIEIALHAMATDPAARHATVQEFQTAVRRYQSHSESIILATRAEDELQRAIDAKSYQQFSKALFGFQESITLWPENRRAYEGEEKAKIAYASAALEKEDFELGLSLLTADAEVASPHFKPQLVGQRTALQSQLATAQRERDARQGRLRNMRRVAVALIMFIFVSVSSALVFIWMQNAKLDQANHDLKDREIKLTKSESSLREKKLALEKNEVVLKAAKLRADQEAEAARLAQKAEAYASYLANIGISAERIAGNGFLDADRLLALYNQGDGSAFRHWEWGFLRRLCHLDVQTLTSPGRVECLAATPDARLVAAGTTRGTLVIWEVAWPKEPAGKPHWTELVQLPLKGPILAAAFSPDGKQMATAASGDEGRIQVWEAGGSPPQFTARYALTGHRGAVLNLAFAESGDKLVSSSRDETARVWNLAKQSEELALRGHFGAVESAQFDTAGQRVVTAGEDSTVRVWSMKPGAAAKVFRGHTQPVYTAAFSPDGTYVASGGRDNEILLWQPQSIQDFDFALAEKALQDEARGKNASDIESSIRHVPDRRLKGHSGEVRKLVFSSDGRELASVAHDNTARVWNLASQAAKETTLRGHGGWVRSCFFAGGTKYLVSGGYDELIKVWQPETYEEVRPLRAHEDAVLWSTFSPDGKRMITAGRDHKALIWSIDGDEPLQALDESPISADASEGPVAALKEGHSYLVNGVAFFGSGDSRVATSAGDDTVRIWDLKAGGQLRRIEGTGAIGVVAAADDGTWLATGSNEQFAKLWNANDESQEPLALAGHRNEVTAIAFSPNQRSAKRRLATGDLGGEIRLWQYDEMDHRWQEYARLTAHVPGAAITSLRFTPDGQRLLSASLDFTVFQWDVATGNHLPKLTLRHADGVKALDLSADGKSAVTLCSLPDGKHCLDLWDLNKLEKKELKFELGGEMPTSVIFAPGRKGAIVVSNSGDASRLRSWDGSSQNLEALWDRPPLRGTVWAIAPTPDRAKLLAVGGNQARLLDLATGKLERSLSPHAAVTCVAYSPSGKWIATSGADGDVKLWHGDADDSQYAKVAKRLPRAHQKGAVAYSVNSVAFAKTPAGEEWLATGGDDASAKVWRVSPSGVELVSQCVGSAGKVTSVCFAKEGELLITSSADGTARIWEAATGKALGDAEGLQHGSPVLHATASLDGTRLLTGTDDNVATLWDIGDVNAPRKIWVMKGHTAAVTCTALSSDLRRALTSSADGTAKVWDLRTGQEVISLKRHTAEVSSVHFSPDDRTILTSSLDRSALVWRSDAWASEASAEP